MRFMHWLVTAYAPLARHWAQVDGSDWRRLHARIRTHAVQAKPQPLWTGIYL